MRTFCLSEGCADAQLLRRSRSDSHDSSLGTFPLVPAYSLCLCYQGTASSRLGTQPLSSYSLASVFLMPCIVSDCLSRTAGTTQAVRVSAMSGTTSDPCVSNWYVRYIRVPCSLYIEP